MVLAKSWNLKVMIPFECSRQAKTFFQKIVSYTNSRGIKTSLRCDYDECRDIPYRLKDERKVRSEVEGKVF